MIIFLSERKTKNKKKHTTKKSSFIIVHHCTDRNHDRQPCYQTETARYNTGKRKDHKIRHIQMMISLNINWFREMCLYITVYFFIVLVRAVMRQLVGKGLQQQRAPRLGQCATLRDKVYQTSQKSTSSQTRPNRERSPPPTRSLS